jgi:hypothetical protein
MRLRGTGGKASHELVISGLLWRPAEEAFGACSLMSVDRGEPAVFRCRVRAIDPVCAEKLTVYLVTRIAVCSMLGRKR